jgi:predicted Fe-Mo cluster-binding NifX family protein
VADESLMDVYSSCLVFVSIAGAWAGISWLMPLATVFISGVVLWAGLKHAARAVLGLMDAAVDPELEQAVRETLETIPGIRSALAIRARRSGPFYFIDGQVEVPGAMDVNRSHALIHRAQDAVFEKHPRVEGVILHVEPHHGGRSRVLVPVQGGEGLAALTESHFGRAPWYLLAVVDADGTAFEKVLANPFQSREVQAGLAVINRLVKEHDIDAVAALEIGEIAYHALHENGVQVYEALPGPAEETLLALGGKRLHPLPGPTHSSEAGEWKEKKTAGKTRI